MSGPFTLARSLMVIGLSVLFLPNGPALASSGDDLTLTGTWVMDSAYEVRPDGVRITTYGEHPLGLLTVDGQGRYSIQIYRVGRAKFASGDKAKGTAQEYREAVVGASTHFGTVAVDRGKRQLVFEVQAASFPNWEGRRQVRDYTYKDGLLTYAVPASASGSGIVAYSLWRRVTR